MSAENSGWARAEVEAAVDDYLDMLRAELSGLEYNKAEHNRALLAKLQGRKRTAVEFKHCNISAVLETLGYRYVSGYKPRHNFQLLLREVVIDRVGANRVWLLRSDNA